MKNKIMEIFNKELTEAHTIKIKNPKWLQAEQKSKTMNCPKCKTNLKETGIGFSQQINGDMTYKVFLRNGELEFEQDDIYTDNTDETFYCRECGEALVLSEEEVIKILK